MGTKQENIDDVESCWNKAEPQEPIFVLKATDELAPETVRHWAGKYLQSKGGLGNMSERQRAKYFKALNDASRMEEWRS